jgi:hypothetical protein
VEDFLLRGLLGSFAREVCDWLRLVVVGGRVLSEMSFVLSCRRKLYGVRFHGLEQGDPLAAYDARATPMISHRIMKNSMAAS